jgi:hypothetical protein
VDNSPLMRSARKTAESLVAHLTRAQHAAAEPPPLQQPAGVADMSYPAGTYGGYPVAGTAPPAHTDAPPGMVRR